MADEADTLVTKEMEAQKGVWGEGSVSYPVTLADIRKWAIAVYWPEKPPRIYWDEEYAQKTRFGGIIAPQDFNPFAWPVERPPTLAGLASAQGSGRGSRGMNGGQVDTFLEPMRPGDVITARSRLKDWNETQTRLGLTLFIRNEIEWLNQNGKVVKRRISTGIRY